MLPASPACQTCQAIQFLPQQPLLYIGLQYEDLHLLRRFNVNVVVRPKHGASCDGSHGLLNFRMVDASKLLASALDEPPAVVAHRQMCLRGREYPGGAYEHHIPHEIRANIGRASALLFAVEPHNSAGNIRFDAPLRRTVHATPPKPQKTDYQTRGPSKRFRR